MLRWATNHCSATRVAILCGIFFFIFTYSLRNSGVLSIEIHLLSCELCQFFRIVCLSITFEPDKLDDRVAGIVWGPAGLVKVA